MRLGNFLQYGCCSEGPMDGFTPLSLSYQQQSTVLIEAAVEAHMKPSAAWMDSRRVSDEVNHYLSTMACFEGRALRSSETLYSMDAAAEAPCMGYPLPFQ
ncbi:hypothetical protein [Alteromonas naphthalenivorans]|nr:hypothetical protein [Alteromonas naphthalenivorans]